MDFELRRQSQSVSTSTATTVPFTSCSPSRTGTRLLWRSLPEQGEQSGLTPAGTELTRFAASSRSSSTTTKRRPRSWTS